MPESSDTDSIISDESSLYGPEPTSTTDHEAYLSYAHRLPSNMAHAARSAAKITASTPPAREPYNPLAGDPASRQLNESAAAFVSRLPPSTTQELVAGPWLWISNPYAPRDHAQHRDVDDFTTAGRALLGAYLAANGGAAATGRGAAAKVEKLKRDLQDAARRHGVTCGKWMLFPSAERVDNVWRTVCEAMVSGELGVQAKVATASANETGGSGRLVCVYTHSFEDVADVRRVLWKLKDLDLVPPRGIWYKADAYTYLNISSKNAYGLRASMYGSRDMLSTSNDESRSRHGGG